MSHKNSLELRPNWPFSALDIVGHLAFVPGTKRDCMGALDIEQRPKKAGFYMQESHMVFADCKKRALSPVKGHRKYGCETISEPKMFLLQKFIIGIQKMSPDLV